MQNTTTHNFAANGISDVEPIYALANREGAQIIPENAVHRF